MAARDAPARRSASLIACSPVGPRVNYSMFMRLEVGSALRVAGRIWAPGILTTTDSGDISVDMGLSDTYGPASFVEVFGTKVTGDRVHAVGIVEVPGMVDEQLWDDTVRMTQLPQLRHLFEPDAGPTPEAEAIAPDGATSPQTSSFLDRPGFPLSISTTQPHSPQPVNEPGSPVGERGDMAASQTASPSATAPPCAVRKSGDRMSSV